MGLKCMTYFHPNNSSKQRTSMSKKIINKPKTIREIAQEQNDYTITDILIRSYREQNRRERRANERKKVKGNNLNKLHITRLLLIFFVMCIYFMETIKEFENLTQLSKF